MIWVHILFVRGSSYSVGRQRYTIQPLGFVAGKLLVCGGHRARRAEGFGGIGVYCGFQGRDGRAAVARCLLSLCGSTPGFSCCKPASKRCTPTYLGRVVSMNARSLLLCAPFYIRRSGRSHPFPVARWSPASRKARFHLGVVGVGRRRWPCGRWTPPVASVQPILREKGSSSRVNMYNTMQNAHCKCQGRIVLQKLIEQTFIWNFTI
jgi:hypothetical protein